MRSRKHKKDQEAGQGSAVQAAQVGRAGTLSVDLSKCKLASAKRGRKQRVVADIEDYLQRRFVGSDKPAEDALKYYLLAPRKLALLTSLTIACGLDRVYYLDAKHQIEQKWSAEKVLKTGVWAEQTRVAESRSTTFLGLR